MAKDFTQYYAVIFTSTQKEKSEGYPEMATKMEELAKTQKGFFWLKEEFFILIVF